MAIAIAEVLVPPRKSPESAETGERLRTLRNEKGLTAREVALGMGLKSPDGYRQYEKGYIVNWTAAVARLARGLRMDSVEVAERLGVPFDPVSSTLEGRIFQAVGPENAHLVDEAFGEIRHLPPDDQRQVIEAMRDQAAGRRARLQRDS